MATRWDIIDANALLKNSEICMAQSDPTSIRLQEVGACHLLGRMGTSLLEVSGVQQAGPWSLVPWKLRW